MLRKVLVAIVTLLILAAPAYAQAEEDPDEGGDPVSNTTNQVKDAVGDGETDPVASKEVLDDPAAQVLADGPAAGVPLLERLLSGTGDLIAGAGAAIANAFSALGSGLASLVMGIGQGFLWSITGVAAIMAGAIAFAGSVIEGMFAAVGWVMTNILGLYGRLQPNGVSDEAWAGGAAVAGAGTVVAAQAGIAHWLRKLGWLGAGIPLFSRIAKDDILDHPLRSTIFETIRTNPGIHVSALSRAVDAGWGTTVHHLRKLQEKEMVAVRLVNNQKCFFENGGSYGRSTWEQISELKNPTAQRVARFVLDHPLQPLTGVSDALQISPSLVSHHVSKMVKAGILQKVRDGRFVKLAVTEEARHQLFGTSGDIASLGVGMAGPVPAPVPGKLAS